MIGDKAGNIICPFVSAPVNKQNINLLEESIDKLKAVLKETGIKIRKKTKFNLDSGFDSKKNRAKIFSIGLKPNIKDNPRNRKKPKRGKKRKFDQKKYNDRFIIERTFAWEDKFKRLLLRFEVIPERFQAFKLLGYTLINLRHFCIN